MEEEESSAGRLYRGFGEAVLRSCSRGKGGVLDYAAVQRL
eukprot:CAMPEP_0195053366 /NCGR_PEP_ID=MMETSP0448-20130528/2523_1 /TAXON_ID=66468 /ORGANISM="Heterocapsa triquestra, Strain CCMP 448" /LENGTH=39 /DNA_ID= /DNA_START= /DNA_END= /DNA_ORIENTATION=